MMPWCHSSGTTSSFQTCEISEMLLNVKTRLSDMQRELALQTNVTRPNQTLHFNGRDVADFLSPNDMIFTQLKTTQDQPVALLPTIHTGHEHQPANIQRILRESFLHRLIMIIMLNNALLMPHP